jgi:AcrR family transcriptional regulator
MEAATDQFARNGFDAARTQAIADAAGVNKAMIYYHFRDKEHLYTEILSNQFVEILSQLFPVLLNQQLPARQKLVVIAESYHRLLSTHPQLRALLLKELAAGGSRLSVIISMVKEGVPGLDFEQVFLQIEKMIESGDLNRNDPRQILLNMISLTVFPFLARPLLENIWGLSPEEFTELIDARPAAVTDLLERGLFASKEVG